MKINKKQIYQIKYKINKTGRNKINFDINNNRNNSKDIINTILQIGIK